MKDSDYHLLTHTKNSFTNKNMEGSKSFKLLKKYILFKFSTSSL